MTLSDACACRSKRVSSGEGFSYNRISMDLDDHLLMKEIGAGSQNAVAELYDRHARLVFSLAYKMLANQKLAEDITQEVFIQVWKTAGSYDGSLSKVTTWLSMITRSRCLDTLRKISVRPEGHQVDLENSPKHQAAQTNVESSVTDNLRRERVRKALREISREQREVLLLAYFYGFTQKKMSDHLQIPLGTVKTRVRLGLQKLREVLSEKEIKIKDPD